MQKTFKVLFLGAAVIVAGASETAVSSPPDGQESGNGGAIEAAKGAVAAATESFGAEDPQTLEATSRLISAYLDSENQTAAAPLAKGLLAALERQTPRNDANISIVTGDVAQIKVFEGRFEEAEALFRRSLELAEKAGGENHVITALALNNLGAFLDEVDRSDEADPIMRRALHIRERALGPTDRLTLQSLFSLGVIAMKQQHMLLAEAIQRQGLAMRREANPPSLRSDIAESQTELAKLLLVTGRSTEAVKLASEAVDNYAASFGPKHIRTMMTMHLKADALAADGREVESDRLHRDLVAMIETLAPPQPELLANALGDYGRHLVHAGQPARAVEIHRRAVAISRAAHGEDQPDTVRLRRDLAESLYAHGEVAEAAKEGREIVAALERADGESVDTGAALVSLGKYLLGDDGSKEARPLLRRAVTILEKSSGQSGLPTMQALSLLATSYVATDDLQAAERVVDDAMSRYQADPDVRSMEMLGNIIGLRAVILRKTGRSSEAEEAETIARQIEADRR